MLAGIATGVRAARRSTQLLVVVAALAPLAAAGCGGGGESPEQPRLTSRELTNRMSHICQEHTDRQVVAIEKYAESHGIPHGTEAEKATSAQLEEELVRVILPIVHDTIHDIGRLRATGADESDLKAFVKALEHGVAASEADPSWIATGATEPFYPARRLSAKLGTALCGQA